MASARRRRLETRRKIIKFALLDVRELSCAFICQKASHLRDYTEYISSYELVQWSELTRFNFQNLNGRIIFLLSLPWEICGAVTLAKKTDIPFCTVFLSCCSPILLNALADVPEAVEEFLTTILGRVCCSGC